MSRMSRRQPQKSMVSTAGGRAVDDGSAPGAASAGGFGAYVSSSSAITITFSPGFMTRPRLGLSQMRFSSADATPMGTASGNMACSSPNVLPSSSACADM